MTSTTDLLRLRAENEALKQSLQHESDVVEAAKEEIIRQRVENANQSEKINALIAENEALRNSAKRWEKLYRRALSEANGLTNYVEDRPGLRSAERRIAALQDEARAALQEPKP